MAFTGEDHKTIKKATTNQEIVELLSVQAKR